MSRRDGDAFTLDELKAEDEEEEDKDEEEDDDDATRDAIELEKVARNGDAPCPPMARLCAPLAPAGTRECEVDTAETVGDGPAELLCDVAAEAAAVALVRCGEAGTGTGEV